MPYIRKNTSSENEKEIIERLFFGILKMVNTLPEQIPAAIDIDPIIAISVIANSFFISF